MSPKPSRFPTIFSSDCFRTERMRKQCKQKRNVTIYYTNTSYMYGYWIGGPRAMSILTETRNRNVCLSSYIAFDRTCRNVGICGISTDIFNTKPFVQSTLLTMYLYLNRRLQNHIDNIRKVSIRTDTISY